MKYLNKVLAKKLPKLKLHDSDLGNIGLISINGKRVTFEEFSKMENIKIRDLNLYGSSVKDLPVGLKLIGHLDLSKSTIEELPEGLQVGGNLWLNDTNIKVLPLDLRVQGKIYISPNMEKTFNPGKFKVRVRV